MTALETLISHGNPILAPRALPSTASGALLKRRSVVDHPRLRLCNPIRRTSLSFCRVISLSTASSHEGSDHPDTEVERVKNEIEKQAEESQEEWRKMVESLKEHAIKMHGMSQEAYEIYSKKAMVIFKDVSEKLKVQAEKARQDMTLIAEEVSVEGKEYLSSAVENFPEPVKEIVDTFASEGAELKEISEVREFFLGIPYGGLLFLGGFLFFMLTGSITAIRFGMILGGALLSLSISSLTAWKEGKSSCLFLRGQAGIAAILFLREFRLLFQRPSIWTSVTALISGAMVAFYVYRITVESKNRGGESYKME